VNPTTIVLALTRQIAPDSHSYGLTLAYAEFPDNSRDEGVQRQKKAATRTLRGEVGKWAKMHKLEPQVAKQLEILREKALPLCTVIVNGHALHADVIEFRDGSYRPVPTRTGSGCGALIAIAALIVVLLLFGKSGLASPITAQPSHPVARRTRRKLSEMLISGQRIRTVWRTHRSVPVRRPKAAGRAAETVNG
jgi:hypothetical protein